MPIKYKCSQCNEVHEGMPGFGAPFPAYYLAIPEGERAARCLLTAEACIIDGQSFFVRGCIEVPVHGADEPLFWGVWVSLSEKNFRRLQREPDCRGPFFGWLSTLISIYPSTLELKALVHGRGHEERPLVELEPTDHPLAVEQREGITIERVSEIHALMTHGHGA